MGQTSPFRGEGRKVRNRRVSPVEAHSGDRLLSQHIAGIQPCRREPLFVFRVFGRLPVTDSALTVRRARGQASEKPQGRKPRGEFAPAVVSVYGDLASM